MGGGIKWEGLIFGGAAIGWALWELFSLRRVNRARDAKRLQARDKKSS